MVTLNYRLGSLGWLSHPRLAAANGGPAGNWGLLDQIAALRWVAQNIAAFGGDPDEVTLAGQSAGALCAMDLLVAPQADGLFHRAILQSPPLVDVAQSPERAVRWAEALSLASGGRDGECDVDRLRALTAEQVVALHEEVLESPEFRGTRGGALPTIDSATLPTSPAEHAGARGDIDVLIGSTAQEGTFFFTAPWRPSPSPERVPAIVADLCHTDDPQAVIDRYREAAAEGGRPTDATSLLVEVATAAMVGDPVARWASSRAAAVATDRGRVYRYRVDHPGAGPILGATHTVDVPLLFGTWRDGGAGQRLGGQAPDAAEVGRELQLAWARFVHGEAPGWDAVVPGAQGAEIGVFGGERAAGAARAEYC